MSSSHFPAGGFRRFVSAFVPFVGPVLFGSQGEEVLASVIEPRPHGVDRDPLNLRDFLA
jgi:hypothetical protein